MYDIWTFDEFHLGDLEINTRLVAINSARVCAINQGCDFPRLDNSISLCRNEILHLNFIQQFESLLKVIMHDPHSRLNG